MGQSRSIGTLVCAVATGNARTRAVRESCRRCCRGYSMVHRPDLPLYGSSANVGLGLWNAPALAFGLEAALLLPVLA